MTMPSPGAGGSMPLDLYQLERLAEELATRESTHASHVNNGLPEGNESDRDLPLYIPLSHDNPYLVAEAFDVEDFLLSRSYTSLPDLRSELRDYLSTLKEELVKLINDDYEAFISLSTDLKGEGARLGRLKYPLSSLKAEVLDSKHKLQAIQDNIQNKLQKRATLRDEKTLLHLLLKISESVTRLESLMLIAAPVQEGVDSPEIGKSKMPTHLSTVEDECVGDRKQGSRAIHLGRVAAEYAQLLYHVSKAQVDKCVFVDEIQWRINRIQSTLMSDLDHVFSSALRISTGVKSEAKITEGEKAKSAADLAECLQTYDMLGLWRDAEDSLRKEVVHEFVKKTIFPGALATPHSPIVPHTPIPNRFKTTEATTNPPRTPYTPFSAYAIKQNPFDSSFRSGASVASPYAYLLDDTDDALASLYNRVLRFVERDMSRIMEIAERIRLKNRPHVRTDKSSISATPAKEVQIPETRSSNFEIMANVIWAEIGRAVMDELGSHIFAVGQPDEFRKNYETTQAFVRSLEFLAPSLDSIVAMRSHPIYTAFHKRWQLPVYFQLRWKEIISKLDVLLTTRIEPTPDRVQAPFITVQAATIWGAISSCWSAETYIPDLGYRFWKLTLQLISRYKTWLKHSLPEFTLKMAAIVTSTTEKNPASPTHLSRATTPIPQDISSPETVAMEDTLLRQWAAAIVDLQAMHSRASALWHEEISMMLLRVTEIDADKADMEDALEHALSALKSLIPPISSQILTILTKRCCEALLPVRSIPSQFRAMSNKQIPTEPSHFVSFILRPLKFFFAIGAGDGPGARLQDTFLEAYALNIVENVSQRYIYYLTAMKKTEESLKRLKKGKITTFSLFGSSAKDDEGRDEERIRTQMMIDVEGFGRDAESLGVRLDSIDAFRSLKDMVHAPFTEGK